MLFRSPFRWSVFDRGDGLLRNGRIDFLRQAQPLEWRQWPDPPRTPAVQAALGTPLGKKYFWFARVPMWEELPQADGSTLVNFWDMRFNTYLRKDGLSRSFGAAFRIKDGQAVENRF